MVFTDCRICTVAGSTPLWIREYDTKQTHEGDAGTPLDPKTSIIAQVLIIYNSPAGHPQVHDTR